MCTILGTLIKLYSLAHVRTNHKYQCFVDMMVLGLNIDSRFSKLKRGDKFEVF